MEHTKGPWAIDSKLPPNARSVICRVGNIPISGNTIGPHTESDEANAQLIAACPDMVDLLEKGVKLRELEERSENAIVNWPDYWVDVKAALARAKGE